MKDQHGCLWEKIGPIGILSLNNPPENYIEDSEFIPSNLLHEILNDKILKGIIIQGIGRHFSAGANLDKIKQQAENAALCEKKLTSGKDLVRIINEMNVPVIASISGVCFGAGLEIALACHIRIFSDNSLFAFPEINYGIMPGLGGTVLLTKLLGEGKATQIILSGEIINSEKAIELKMVDFVISKKELHQFSLNYLTKITNDRDFDVIHSIMKSIHNAVTLPFEEALKEETKLFCSLAVKSMKENKT
jgi:enoyl-CoA hydratase/carnithine racemase